MTKEASYQEYEAEQLKIEDYDYWKNFKLKWYQEHWKNMPVISMVKAEQEFPGVHFPWMDADKDDFN